MPKYEYACKSCGERLEVMQSFTDDPLTECPACGGVLRKVFSVPSISFKGKGFYRTDNRQGRPSGAKDDGAKTDSGDTKAPAASDAKSEPSKTSETSTDSKPKAAEAKSA